MPKKVQKPSVAKVCLLLSDVARNRNSRPPHLVSAAIDLSFWEAFCAIVNGGNEIHSLSPDNWVFVVASHYRSFPNAQSPATTGCFTDGTSGMLTNER